MDASDQTSANILLQYNNDGISRLDTFYSKKNSTAEVNYESFDK